MDGSDILRAAGTAIQDLGIAHPADEYAGSIEVFVSQVRHELFDEFGELAHPYCDVLKELQGFSLVSHDPDGLAVAITQVATHALFVRTAVERHRTN